MELQREGGGELTVGMDIMQYKMMRSTEECTARKRLVGDDGVVNVRGQGVPNLAGKVADAVLRLEYGETAGVGSSSDPSNTPGKNPIVKRRKQGDGGWRRGRKLIWTLL